MESFDLTSLLRLSDITIENSEFSDANNAYFRVSGLTIYTLATISSTSRRTKDEFLEPRKNALAPFLMFGIEGDAQAQTFYENTRDLYFSALPDWAKNIIGHHFVQAAKSLLPQYMTGEWRALAKHAIEHGLLGDKDRRLGCGLDLVQNYTAGLEFASLCDVNREKVTGLVKGSMPQDDDPLLCCWSYTHDSSLVTEALRRTLPLMLKCVILDDFLNFKNFGFLSPEIILESYIGPWDVLESPQIQRLLQAQSYYEENAQKIPNRQSFLTKAMSTRNLDILLDRISTHREESKGNNSESLLSAILPVVRSSNVAQLMKESIVKALEDYCPELNSRSYRRELIKMMAYYEDCTLTQVIHEIIEGGDPLERLRNTYEKANQELGEDLSEVTLNHDLMVENDDAQATPIDELKVINLALNENDESPFLNALSALRDPIGKSAVGRLLRRFQLGYPGSSKQIRPRLYEEILNIGPGYRVYFSKTKSTPIVLLGFGSKATQDADIANALELLKDFSELKMEIQ